MQRANKNAGYCTQRPPHTQKASAGSAAQSVIFRILPNHHHHRHHQCQHRQQATAVMRRLHERRGGGGWSDDVIAGCHPRRPGNES